MIYHLSIAYLSSLHFSPELDCSVFIYAQFVSSQCFGVRQKLSFSQPENFATTIQKLSFSRFIERIPQFHVNPGDYAGKINQPIYPTPDKPPTADRARPPSAEAGTIHGPNANARHEAGQVRG